MNKQERDLLQIISESRDIFCYLAAAGNQFEERSVGKRIKDYFKVHGYSSSEVFRNGGLDRSYGYDILSDRTKKPGRDKMLMMAIGMGLTLEKAQKFLDYLGYARINLQNKRDSIVAYGLCHGFQIRDINEVLYTEELKELK